MTEPYRVRFNQAFICTSFILFSRSMPISLRLQIAEKQGFFVFISYSYWFNAGFQLLFRCIGSKTSMTASAFAYFDIEFSCLIRLM